MSGHNDASDGSQGILIGLSKPKGGTQGILIGMSRAGTQGILIGLSVAGGLLGILIGLLLFLPPESAVGMFGGSEQASFLMAACPSLTGGEGELLPAVNKADGEGELLPAVNVADVNGDLHSCLGIFGGETQLMSFFACQNNARGMVGLEPMSYGAMCSATASLNPVCLKECNPNVPNPCGDSGLTCTKENGGYFCDGAACRPGQYGGKCDEKCDPNAANSCQPGLTCKAAGESFSCQGASCANPNTQPTEPANPQDQPTEVCTLDPNDNMCSVCENTDLDSNACVCNMDGVCGPGEGFNCGDCQAPSSGDQGNKPGGNNNGGGNSGGNQCTCINGFDSCTQKKC